MSAGLRTATLWEVRKLARQRRTWLGLAAVALTPLIFVAAVLARDDPPDGLSFGRIVSETGLAVPLVGLAFASLGLFVAVAALVGGDIVASEHQQGTLTPLITRSVGRLKVFTAKALATGAYAAACLALYGVISLAAGVAFWGFNPLTTLSGTVVSEWRGLAFVTLSFAVTLMPLLAVGAVAVCLSTLTRSSAAAVVGTILLAVIMQTASVLPGLEAVEPYLLTEQFTAWRGLTRTPVDLAPVAHAAWVSAAWAGIALGLGGWAFCRRDVT